MGRTLVVTLTVSDVGRALVVTNESGESISCN